MEVFEAAVLRNLGRPLTIEKIIMPVIGITQVLVKLEYSGVCRSQLMEVSGGRGEDRWLPHLLGHEAVGTVIDLGGNVEKVRVGDKVVVSWLTSSGADAPPPQYKTLSGETINSGKTATFAEYCIVPENRIFKKPQSFSDIEAVLLGCAIPTGAGMVLHEFKPKPTDRVLIVGLGGIGLSALLTCIALGVKSVTVADPKREKLKIAKALGATDTILYPEEEISITGERKLKFDVCYEAGGTVDSIEFGFSAISPQGTLVFASHPPTGHKISLDPHALISGKKIIGTWGGGNKLDQTVCMLNKLSLDGKFDASRLVGNIYNLSDINSALDDLSLSTTTRPIISF